MFQYLRLAQGLKGGPQTYTRLGDIAFGLLFFLETVSGDDCTFSEHNAIHA